MSLKTFIENKLNIFCKKNRKKIFDIKEWKFFILLISMFLMIWVSTLQHLLLTWVVQKWSLIDFSLFWACTRRPCHSVVLSRMVAMEDCVGPGIVTLCGPGHHRMEFCSQGNRNQHNILISWLKIDLYSWDYILEH